MPATKRQLRKKQKIFYGRRPPPWFASKPTITSDASKRKRTASEVSVENNMEIDTSGKDQAASGTADNVHADGSSFTSIQDAPSDLEADSSTDRIPYKRARSATVIGDEEMPIHDASSVPFSERRRTGESSREHTSLAVSPQRNAGKARADLSPAAEAAIRQMRAEIKEGIKTLKRIRTYVDDLLGFEAILGYQAAENGPGGWED